MSDLKEYFASKLREGQSSDDIMRELVKQCAAAQCDIDEEKAKLEAKRKAKAEAEAKAQKYEARKLELGATLMNAMADYVAHVKPGMENDLMGQNLTLAEKLACIDSAIDSALFAFQLQEKLKSPDLGKSTLGSLDILDQLTKIFS